MKYSLLLLAALAASSFAAEAVKVQEESPKVTATASSSTPYNTTIICNQPQQSECECETCDEKKEDTAAPAAEEPTLSPYNTVRVSVTGQGVAPMNTSSPAQAYALSKRAAIADAYRLIAEKVKGVRVEGQDLIKNMMVKRSTVRTHVDAMVREANIVETTFKEGLCEVEMEIVLTYSQFAQ